MCIHKKNYMFPSEKSFLLNDDFDTLQSVGEAVGKYVKSCSEPRATSVGETRTQRESREGEPTEKECTHAHS